MPSNEIVEGFARALDYLNDPRFPKVTEIRGVRRVKSEKHFHGYSFTFEACVNGEWLQYGPIVNGNWSVRSDCEDRLPETDSLWAKKDTKTIYIGWYRLNELFASLPLEDK